MYLLRRLLVSYVNQRKGVENNPTQMALLRLELLRLGRSVRHCALLRECLDCEQFDSVSLSDLLKVLSPESAVIEALNLTAAVLSARAPSLHEQASALLNTWLADHAAKQIITGAGTVDDESDVAALLSALLADDRLDPSHTQSLTLALSTRKAGLPTLLAQSVVPQLQLAPGKTLAQLLVDLSGTMELRTNTELIHAALVKFGWPSTHQQNDSLDLRAAELFSSLGQLGAASSSVDIPTIMTILNSYPTRPSYKLIMRAFDAPNNPPPTPNILASILLSAPVDQIDDESPLNGLVGTWVNPALQISAVAGLLSLPSDQVSFTGLSANKVITADYVNQSSPAIKAMAAAVQASLWNCIDVVDIVVKLQDHGPEPVNVLARELLETGCRTHGETILLGLVQLPKPWSSYHLELITRLLALFLAGNPSHQLVFLRLWQIDRNFLLGAFKQFYHDNNMNVTRILDVAQDLKVCLSVSKCTIH